MNYLLDTHTLLWFLEDDEKLGDLAKSEIVNIENKCFVSIASLWEIALKVNIGKLELGISFSDFEIEIQKNNIEILPINIEHLNILLSMEFYHRDPFDRILIAQAQCEGFIMITKDDNIEKYNLQVLW